jgi:hypothetical protein
MKPVRHCFAYCPDDLREQIANVVSGKMTTQPNGIMNHPAWVLGRLTFGCQTLGGEFGLPPWLPASFAERFGTGRIPVADSRLCEPRDEAIAMLDAAANRISSAVIQLASAQPDLPLPDEKVRVPPPTVRHAIRQVLVAHPANHIGQLTLWRQATGLPRLTRPFV